MMAKIGRPTKRTKAVVEEICSRIAGGESLRAICRDEHLPDRITVLRWALFDESFRNRYVQAREMQAESMADELLEISDDGMNDWMERRNADGECVGYTLNGEAVQRSKLRVDTRKWIASRLLPKKYGDRIQQEHSGSISLTLAERIERARNRADD